MSAISAASSPTSTSARATSAISSANEIISHFFPGFVATRRVAFVIAIVVGLTLGVLSAVRQNGIIDHLAMFFSVVRRRHAELRRDHLMIVIFWVELQARCRLSAGTASSARRSSFPAIALSLESDGVDGPLYPRGDAGDDPHGLRSHRAREGARPRCAVMLRHALPNALIPVITIAGVAFADLITGSFFVEAICGVPGIGRYFVTTVADKDYPVLMAVTLLYAVAHLVDELRGGHRLRADRPAREAR